MCVDSLPVKIYSDKKQPTRLYISVFSSDCILSPTNVYLFVLLGGFLGTGNFYFKIESRRDILNITFAD